VKIDQSQSNVRRIVDYDWSISYYSAYKLSCVVYNAVVDEAE